MTTKRRSEKNRRTKRARDGHWPERDGTRALVLEPDVFTRKPREIAAALKAAAEASTTRKGTPRQTSMAVLSFQLNRAGRSMDPGRRERLTRAKQELTRLFERSGT